MDGILNKSSPHCMDEEMVSVLHIMPWSQISYQTIVKLDF